MINVGNSVVLVIVAAVVTLILRAAPFAIFSGKRQMPAKAKKVADMLPAAIMAVLVIYCIKSDILSVKAAVMSADMSGLISVISTVVALVGVVLVHLWKRQTLLSIAVGTVIYMALIRLLPIIM